MELLLEIVVEEGLPWLAMSSVYMEPGSLAVPKIQALHIHFDLIPGSGPWCLPGEGLALRILPGLGGEYMAYKGGVCLPQVSQHLIVLINGL